MRSAKSLILTTLFEVEADSAVTAQRPSRAGRSVHRREQLHLLLRELAEMLKKQELDEACLDVDLVVFQPRPTLSEILGMKNDR